MSEAVSGIPRSGGPHAQGSPGLQALAVQPLLGENCFRQDTLQTPEAGAQCE